MQAPVRALRRSPMVLLALLACAPDAGRAPPSEDPSAGWLDEVAARVANGARAWRAEAEGFRAEIPGLSLEAELDRDGLRLRSEGETLSVSLASWGREGGGQAFAPGAPRLGACADLFSVEPDGDCSRRVELSGEGATEWWVSREDGLQQGWDLEQAPPGEGLLALDLEIEGASVEVEAGGERAWLDTPGGQSFLVRDIAAWDAVGEPLDAWLEAGEGGLVLLVDDADAVWPITVDPIYTTAGTTLSGPGSNSYFGWSVDGAGDVNNDGYDDVIVGAYYYSSGTGYAYVYHGSASGLSSSASTTLSGTSSSYFGYSVTGVGDVNNDGYDDVAVGSPAYSSNSGRAYVYHGSSSGVSTTASTTLSGMMSSYLGAAVAAAGDVNNDGYDDLAVGAPWNGGNSGTVYVYHGSSSGISSTATSTVNGPGPNSYFGWSVAGGDVTGDGYSDLLVGAYYRSSYTGAAYLYRSSGSSISTTATTSLTGSSSSYFGWDVDLADVNGDGYADAVVGSYNYSSATGLVSWFRGSSSGLATSATGTLSGSSSSRFGFSVGSADVNADGYDDVIVGSPYYSSYYGRVSLYHGGSSGPSSATSTLTGSTSSGYLGYSVAGAGDVNGDGYEDVVAGAPYVSSYTGAAYLYLGYADQDGDGIAAGTDCDDSDATIGSSITFYRDADGDGFGVESSTASGCVAPGGYAEERDEGFDCDDSSPLTYPGAEEVLDDGVDEDCDGEELCYLDADSDGYRGDETSTVASDDLDCEDEGEAATDLPAGDCDDADPDTNPGVDEQPGNENDDDCDGEELCYVDEDADGYRSDDDTVRSDDLDCRDEGEARSSAPEGDCDDDDAETSPGQGEIPDDGIDQDCSGGDTCYADADDDGYRETAGEVVESADLDCDDSGEASLSEPTGDCDGSSAAVSPGGTEVCDGLDNDCNGLVDVVIPTEGPAAYYEISLCEDSDDDGLLDYTERTVTFTDPESSDTDGDGVEDGTEYGLSEPEDDEATGSEFDADEDPSTTTDPLNPDTDDDGLLDGDEDENGNGQVDSGETDPNLADTDGGGRTDLEERQDGTNPNDASDDVGGGDDTGGGGGEGGGEGGDDTGSGKDGGCDCATADAPSRGALFIAGLLGALALRRRRS